MDLLGTDDLRTPTQVPTRKSAVWPRPKAWSMSAIRASISSANACLGLGYDALSAKIATNMIVHICMIRLWYRVPQLFRPDSTECLVFGGSFLVSSVLEPEAVGSQAVSVGRWQEGSET